MATRKANKKVSQGNFSGDKLNICVLVSQWHKDITDALLEGVFNGTKKLQLGIPNQLLSKFIKYYQQMRHVMVVHI